ncbi:hypothetical protein [Mangrovicella endophytica]|uniref:hypothetical protein n=1 Tax=Mangrovicella endophytica TaxID=2066697 RepID=UPI000C9EA5D2|nr:hypothetical protein [Mangrovicella endophytica]
MQALVEGVPAAMLQLWTRWASGAGLMLLVGFVTVVAALGYGRPVNNWDKIAYVAAVEKAHAPAPATLHARTWSIMRDTVPAGQLAGLANGDAYRSRQFTDPNAFASQIGMYGVKWLYVEVLRGSLSVFGVQHGAEVVNVGVALVFLAVLVLWLQATGNLVLAPLVVGFLMIAGYPALAMAVTPDLMAATFVLAGLLALDRDKPILGGLALVLAVLTRPDVVVLTGLLVPVAWLWRDRLWPSLAGIFVASAAAYLFAVSAGSHVSYWAHLWFSTYQIQASMTDFHPAFSLRVYLTALAYNLLRAAVENTWLGIFIAGLGALAAMAMAGMHITGRRRVLITALMTAVVAKFILFPLHDGRVYVPLLLPVFLMLLAEVRRNLSSRGLADAHRPAGIAAQ